MLAAEWRRLIGRLAASIRETRTLLGWSQSDLAARAVVSQGAISRLESSKHSDFPFHTVLVVLHALALGVTELDIPLSAPIRFLLAFMQGFDGSITIAPPDPGLVTLARAYHHLSDPGRRALVALAQSAAAFKEVAA